MIINHWRRSFGFMLSTTAQRIVLAVGDANKVLDNRDRFAPVVGADDMPMTQHNERVDGKRSYN